MCLLPPELIEAVALVCDNITRYRLYVALGSEDAALTILEEIPVKEAAKSGATDVLLALDDVWTRYKIECPLEKIRACEIACDLPCPETMDFMWRTFKKDWGWVYEPLRYCRSVESVAWVMKHIKPKAATVRQAWSFYSRRGQTDLLRHLLAIRPKIVPFGPQAISTLQQAIFYGHKDCAQYIWAELCPLEPASTFHNAIRSAACRGKTETVRWFFGGRRELWTDSLFKCVVEGCPRETVEWAWRQGRGRLLLPELYWVKDCKHADTAEWIVQMAPFSANITVGYRDHVDVHNLETLHGTGALALGADFLAHVIRDRRIDIIEWLYSKREYFTAIDWAQEYERELLDDSSFAWDMVPFLHDQGVRPTRNIHAEVQARFKPPGELDMTIRLLKLVCDEYGVVYTQNDKILQQMSQSNELDMQCMVYLVKRFDLKFSVSDYFTVLGDIYNYSASDLNFVRSHLEREPTRADDKRVYPSQTHRFYSLREARFYERLWAD